MDPTNTLLAIFLSLSFWTNIYIWLIKIPDLKLKADLSQNRADTLETEVKRLRNRTAATQTSLSEDEKRTQEHRTAIKALEEQINATAAESAEFYRKKRSERTKVPQTEELDTSRVE